MTEAWEIAREAFFEDRPKFGLDWESREIRGGSKNIKPKGGRKKAPNICSYCRRGSWKQAHPSCTEKQTTKT